MKIRLIKMRRLGVELDRRLIKETFGHRGQLVVQDVTDQGLRRPCKIARFLQGDSIRSELKDVHLVWANGGRMTLSGYERVKNDVGELVDYAQAWLCIMDDASPDLR
jgi:hypothetical protein